MTGLREARAAAIRRRYRDLCDSLTEALPGLLNELDAIDQVDFAGRNGISDRFAATLTNMTPEQWAETVRRLDELTEPVAVKRADDAPSDAELAAWIERNPKAFADWAAKQARISGTATTRGAARGFKNAETTKEEPPDGT